MPYKKGFRFNAPAPASPRSFLMYRFFNGKKGKTTLRPIFFFFLFFKISIFSGVKFNEVNLFFLTLCPCGKCVTVISFAWLKEIRIDVLYLKLNLLFDNKIRLRQAEKWVVIRKPSQRRRLKKKKKKRGVMWTGA